METTDNNKLKEIQASINSIIDTTIVEQSLRDNKLEFLFGDIKYRVNKPTFAHRQEVYRKQASKYTELLKDKTFMFEEDLKKLYKERGIDTDSIVTENAIIDKKKNDLLYNLGEAIKNKKADVELERMKKDVEELASKQQQLLIKRTSLFENSIETQMQVYVYSYLSFLVTEKLIPGKDLGDGNKEMDKWVKAWDTYEEFISSPERTVNTILFYASLLIKNEIEI